MRQGTYISFADSQDGAETRIVTDETPLPVSVSAENSVPVNITGDVFDPALAQQTEVLQAVLREIRLLSARFEEAFVTHITQQDIDNDY